MPVDVIREMAALETMTLAELRSHYAELFGETTRKSTSEGLDAEITSLDVQRQAGEAYIQSQAQEGWVCLPERYDDGGYSGADMERPALQRLMQDVEAGKVDVIVVYKVDRSSRSLVDFAQLISSFEKHEVAFVAVTQHFNTSDSMGRLRPIAAEPDWNRQRQLWGQL